MAYIADLHTHSRFSRACSPQLNIPNLVQWAKLKGLDILGTGDFLHPAWYAELKRDLQEKDGFLIHNDSGIKFVPSVEVASIYTHKGKSHRVHNIILMSDLVSVEKFQKKLLEKNANISSDGRPIVGISSRNLLEICLEIDDKTLFIPAHLWTPWFGAFGSQSGYDSLKDCFEDLTDYVYGIETGLSSDPAMNWRVGELDNKSILSFSDAHSLPNLGRESTVIGRDINDGYNGLWEAIKQPSLINKIATPRLGGARNDGGVLGTIEFYPEEGKYHYTGHRKCNIKYTPDDTRRKGTICPICHKGLTVGVMERVEYLATRSSEELRMQNSGGIIKSEKFSDRSGYRMLVPLIQIIAESMKTSTTSQKVIAEYKKLVITLGGEIKVLTKASSSDISEISGPKIAEGVMKDRSGDLVIDPGYDGVYGIVKIWNDGELKEKIPTNPQLELFE